jgi:Protein of unknown function (DUF3703)
MNRSDELREQNHWDEALAMLHQAHNLGRDHILIHCAAHWRYVRFSIHEGNYRRATGHFYWSLSSPYYVPRDRMKRRADIGSWQPLEPPPV